MLHTAHQLVANFVSLPSQPLLDNLCTVVLTELFCWIADESNAMRAVRVNQNSKEVVFFYSVNIKTLICVALKIVDISKKRTCALMLVCLCAYILHVWVFSEAHMLAGLGSICFWVQNSAWLRPVELLNSFIDFFLPFFFVLSFSTSHLQLSL